jgi:hypothetical protein
MQNCPTSAFPVRDESLKSKSLRACLPSSFSESVYVSQFSGILQYMLKSHFHNSSRKMHGFVPVVNSFEIGKPFLHIYDVAAFLQGITAGDVFLGKS